VTRDGPAHANIGLYAEVALSIGPSAIYDAYRERKKCDLGLRDESWNLLSSWDGFSLVNGFFIIPSKRIWDDRGLDANTGEGTSILFEEVEGTGDTCEGTKVSEAQLSTNPPAGDKCNVVHGIQLYNHTSDYTPAAAQADLTNVCIRLGAATRACINLPTSTSGFPERKAAEQYSRN
jgi:hypothetical protein